MDAKVLSNFKFRSELQGLRAFAVLIVIVNHINEKLMMSGYLGVDMFFVISGYVITANIFKSNFVNAKEFLFSFYEKRVKRILPPLIFFVLITSLLICFFNPDPQLALRTGIFSLFGLSNFYLVRQQHDYFAQSTDFNPFVHTWSLSVEEQFYFLFPLLIILTGFLKDKKKSLIKLSFLLFLLSSISLSLYFYFYFTAVDQSGAYFLMPMRFWQIAIGSIAYAIQVNNKRLRYELNKIPCLLIFLFLILCIFTPLEYRVFISLIFTFLTAILIINLNKNSKIFGIFTSKPILFIGNISYSLYLWHWGILSLSKWTIGISLYTIPIQLILIFAISSLSYLFIEKPFKKLKFFKSSVQTIFSGVLVSSFGGVSLAGAEFLFSEKLYLSDIKKHKTRVNQPIDFVGSESLRKAKKCHTIDGQEIDQELLNYCLDESNKKEKFVSFIGDSHTLSLFPMAEKLSLNKKYNSFIMSRGGCAFPSQGETKRKGCNESMNKLESFITKKLDQSQGGLIISSSFLLSHFGYDGRHRKQFLKFPDGSRDSVNKNLIDFGASVKDLSNTIRESNSSLILFAPLPFHPVFRTEQCFSEWFRPSWAIHEGCYKTNRIHLEQDRKHILSFLKKIENEIDNLHIYDPYKKLCDDKYCYVQKNDKVFFSDDDHISDVGINYIYKDFISFLKERKLMIED